MAAKPNIRFMTTGRGGKVHAVSTKTHDLKESSCATVKKRHRDGLWGRKKGVSPDAALSLDECSQCGTHTVAAQVIEANKTPAQKRAEAKERSEETRRHLKPGGNRPKKSPKGADRSTRPSGGGSKRRGPKGGDPTARMKANVEEHAALAEQHGWTAKAWESGTNEWTCEATRSNETLKLIYRDGRTVWARVVLASGVEVRLRNSSNWRKHAMGEGKVKPDYTPRSRGGKKAARKEVIDDEAVRIRLTFDPVEDDDDTIIESLVGKRITWRNSLSNSLDSAVVPTRSRNVRVTIHPKSDRRIISFHESQGMSERGEMLGGERSVYLDKILKVGGAAAASSERDR